MAITIDISPELKIVLTIISGTITDQRMLAHDRELEKMDGFNPSFNHIIDVTAVSEHLVTETGFMELAKNTPFTPDCRRAIVVADGTAQHNANVFSNLINAPSDNIFVTHDREKAYAWLLGKLE